MFQLYYCIISLTFYLTQGEGVYDKFYKEALKIA